MLSWLVRDGSQEGIEKFMQQLFMPPLGVKKDAMRQAPGWSPEEQGNQFLSMMAGRAGRTGQGQ